MKGVMAKRTGVEGRPAAADVLSLCAETALRLGLGAMFLYAACVKIEDPGRFQTMVDGYRVLPACATALFAVTMPMAELLVGALFICTKWTREAAIASAAMLAMFVVALAQAQIRGLDVSCACFGAAGREPHAAFVALVRDVVLAVPVVWLVFKGRHRWIADFRRIWYTSGK